jgi:hypothetical protein
LVRIVLLNVTAVDSNYSHRVRIKLEKSGGKCGHADDVDFVSFSCRELERDILRVVN